MVVVRRGWAETIPQLEAAEPEPDPAAVVYCGGKTLVWTGPPSPQPVAAEDMAEAKHVISGWGQTDLAIEKAAGRPFPAFHVATLDTLKASKVPADVNCVTVWGIRAEGDVPPFMMRRRDRPQVAEPVQQAVTAWPPSPSVVDMTFLGVGAVAEKAASAPVPDVPQRIDAEECQRRLRITEAKILEQEAKEFWTKERQKAVLEAYRGQAGIFHLGK